MFGLEVASMNEWHLEQGVSKRCYGDISRYSVVAQLCTQKRKLEMPHYLLHSSVYEGAEEYCSCVSFWQALLDTHRACQLSLL